VWLDTRCRLIVERSEWNKLEIQREESNLDPQTKKLKEVSFKETAPVNTI
jgi:hypothetical protein